MVIKAETGDIRRKKAGIAAGRELQVKDLYYSYGEKAILQGLDFRVAAGELCVLLGANGAGKSTLVKCISGLLRPQRGKIFWENRDMAGLRLKERAKIFGYVPQNTHTGDGLTVMETVLSGRFPHFQRGLHQRSGSKDLEKAAELLKEFGLEELSFRSVKLLSGGERQRVLIARAVAQEPQVLLLDEPTSNLDLRYQVEVMRLIRRLSRERGLAVIAIIHDLNLALDYGDRAVVLKQGKIAAEGKPGKTVTAQVISDAYQIPVEIFDVGGRQMVAPLVF